MVRFDGETYDEDLDGARLGGQLAIVRGAMLNRGWITLARLEDQTGYPQGSISARIRDFRKERFGRHLVESRRIPGGNGEWEYRLTPNDEDLLATLFPNGQEPEEDLFAAFHDAFEELEDG